MNFSQDDLVVPLTLPVLPGSLEPVPDRPDAYRPTPLFRVLETAASTLSLAATALVASEVCGRYRTWDTDPTMPLDTYVSKPQTCDAPALYRYLKPARDTDAGSLATEAVGYAFAGATSPMQAWLALAASMPSTAGGADLPRPEVAAVVSRSDGTTLPAEGRYLAYDLLWRSSHPVALQWIGSDPIPARDLLPLSRGIVSAATLSVVDRDHVDQALAMVGELLNIVAESISDEMLALAPLRYIRQTTSADDVASHAPA